MRTVALAAVLLPALSAAADVSPASRIDAVTVYQSSARVTRVARADVQPGPSRVLLTGLPDQLDDDSIRVEGKGSAKARIFGVTVDRVTGEAIVQSGARAAEERLERLQDEDRSLDDRAKAAQARLEFVKSLRSTYSDERAKNLAVRGVTAKEWADLAAFVSSELSGATEEIRKTEVLRRDLARRVAQARADLEKVQAKRGQTTKTVAVEVEADRAGALELAVSYVVHAAGWQPIWDARLVPETSTMELSFLGSVWQRTGEDWQGVSLSVSTAQPGRGLFVPELQPVWLTKFEPPRPTPLRAPSAPAPIADRFASGMGRGGSYFASQTGCSSGTKSPRAGCAVETDSVTPCQSSPVRCQTVPRNASSMVDESGTSRASQIGCQPADGTAYDTASSSDPARSASSSIATVFVVWPRFAWTFSSSARAWAIFLPSWRRAASPWRISWAALAVSAATKPNRSDHSLIATGRTARFFARSSE